MKFGSEVFEISSKIVKKDFLESLTIFESNSALKAHVPLDICQHLSFGTARF